MKTANGVKLGLASLVFAILCAWLLTQSGCNSSTFGCNGLTGSNNSPFTGCTGGQNIPPQSSVNFVGTSGTVFAATVSDTIASYSFQGTVPLTIIYVNSVPPVRILATMLSPAPALLSVQALSAGIPTQLISTSTPGATISVGVGGVLPALSGPAACDVRFLVNGPVLQTYQSLLEQNNNAYENTTTAPTLFLLGQAQGDVDGIFTEIAGLFGPLRVNLVINGKVADAGAGTSFTVKSGCP
jgi:hypothetical protein